MPNRILKETIKQSPQIDCLSWFEEVVYYRLIVTADDYGCVDGRIILLKNELFPTKDTISKKSIEAAIDKLASVGLIVKYEVDGRPYLYFPTWEKHQRVRNKHRKYPEPTDENICRSFDGQATASCQPESNIESNIESNMNPNVSTVLTLTLNDGSEYGITQDDIEEYKKTYPAVDIEQQFRSMRQWCKDNPTKRKTKTGIRRFVNSWLEREQNKPHLHNDKPSDQQGISRDDDLDGMMMRGIFERRAYG